MRIALLPLLVSLGCTSRYMVTRADLDANSKRVAAPAAAPAIISAWTEDGRPTFVWESAIREVHGPAGTDRVWVEAVDEWQGARTTGWTLLGVGLAAFTAGGIALGTGLTSNDEGDGSVVAVGLGAIFMGIGGLSTLFGGGMLAGSNYSDSAEVKAPPAR